MRKNDGEAGQAYSAPAVDKAFEIIDLVSGEVAGLSVTDMALRLNRSTSQIYRIVVSLHRLGILRRNEQTDRYELALKLFELATRHPPLKKMTYHAGPILARLAGETDQSCHLATLTGNSLIILAQADSPMPMHYTVKLGSRFPAMETSSGVVIAAHCPPNQQHMLLAEFSAEEQALYQTRFKSILQNKYERRESDVTAGVINLSMPVLDAGKSPIGALTVPFLPQRRMRMQIDEVLAEVIAAAEELTTIMQYD